MPDLKEVSTSLVELRTELEKIRDAATLIGDARDIAAQAIDSALKVAEKAGQVSGRVEDLVKLIEALNLATRFEKLDATVSATNTGVQNAIARVESAEKHLATQGETQNKEIQRSVRSLGEGLSRSLKIHLYLIVAVLIGTAVMVISFALYR